MADSSAGTPPSDATYGIRTRGNTPLTPGLPRWSLPGLQFTDVAERRIVSSKLAACADHVGAKQVTLEMA